MDFLHILVNYSVNLFSIVVFEAISASEVAAYAQKFCTTYNCVIKAIEPQATVTLDDLKNAVAKITYLEEGRNILPWDEEKIPEELVTVKPNPG